MITTAILIGIYIVGYSLAFTMLKIDHLSEEKPYTQLHNIVNRIFSLGSFITILIVLSSTWFFKIAKTGYWNKPILNPKHNADK